MNLTIGRFGFDVQVDSVSGWDEQGSRVSVSGQTPYGSVADALTLRQQLNGLVDSPDESFVPVTWADQPEVNGFYRVMSVSVSPRPAVAFAGVYTFSVELERVQGFAAPLIECVAVGKLRATTLGLTKRPMQAVPVAARSYVEYQPDSRVLIPRAVDVVRVGESSSVNVFSAFGNDYIVGQFYLPAESFYDAAATLRVGVDRRVAVGRQIRNTPDAWELSNDLFQVRSVAGTDFVIQFRMFTGTSWAAWETVTLSSKNFSDPRLPLPAPHTITVLRNSPEAVTIRLLTTASGEYSPVMVDLTLRRGARHVAVELSSVFTSEFAVALSNFASPVSLTGGFRKIGGVLRTNRAENPEAANVTDGYYGLAGGVGAVSAVRNTDSGTYARITAPADATYLQVNYGASGLLPVTPGESLVISADLRTSAAARTGIIYAEWYDSAGTGLTPASTTITIGTNWGRVISDSFIVPANAVRVDLLFQVDGPVAANSVIDLKRILVGPSGAYFSGSTPATTGLVYGWLGTAEDSKSVEGTKTVVVGSAIKSGIDTGGLFILNENAVISRESVPFCVGQLPPLEGAQTILNEYFWAGSEKQTVVAR